MEASPNRSIKHLHEELLLLWQVNSVLELIEVIRANLQKLFLSQKCIHSFTFDGNKSLLDFYSGEKLPYEILCVGNTSTPNQSCIVSLSLQARAWLVNSSYISPDEKVCAVRVQGVVDGENNQGLLFLISGDELLCETALLEIYISHAAACYKRLIVPLSSQLHNVVSDHDVTDFLINCTDAITMQKTLNRHLSDKTSSECCCVLLVSAEINQTVCNVVGEEVLQFEVCQQMDDGVFSSLCTNTNPAYLNNLNEREADQLQTLFGFEVRTALCVPITVNKSRTTQGIVCLCNKAPDHTSFSTLDAAIVNGVMKKSWSNLSSLLALQKEIKLRHGCETMLRIAENLFTHLDDVGALLSKIILEASSLTYAERCSLFILDKSTNELVSKVFDGIITIDESLDPRQYDYENMKEIRFPRTHGIAGHVASTGELLNIVDAYSHPLFYRAIDERTGFRTRNILCFPIKDHNGVVVGVSQLCNKMKGPYFTSYDEELAEKFAVFCGIAISHSLLYKAVEEAGSRYRVANELVTYHMKVDNQDIEKNMPCTRLCISEIHPDFDKFVFPPRNLSCDVQVKAAILMYQDLGLTTKFHIPDRTLLHFILMVRKGYRDPPYHNWDHAFSVMHHAYLLAKNLHLAKRMSDLEVIALLTATMCHDIDHRGTNNAFQISSKSTLANLYSSEGSVLERHHFAQSMLILSTAGCNIFENMKRRDYTKTLDLMKHIILATDVATHLSVVPQLEVMARDGLKFSDMRHKKLLLGLCMTASDLSDQTKDWETTKNTAKLIYMEFFYQGDMEKRMGNQPAIINDRERACIPELQINFMVHVALPAYRILATLFKDYEEVHQRVLTNIRRWKGVEEAFRRRQLPATGSLDFLTDEFYSSLQLE